MPTNQRGGGTVNVPLNLLTKERQMFGEIAIREDRSLGETIRRLAVEGLRLRDAVTAGELESARRERRRDSLLKGGSL